MPDVFEIPLTGTPQRFAIALGDATYVLCFQYRNPGSFGGTDGDWVLDIGDSMGQPLVCGIPLVTGANLLAQYDYLNFSGELWVRSDGVPAAVPSYLGLGLTSHVLWIAWAPGERDASQPIAAPSR